MKFVDIFVTQKSWYSVKLYQYVYQHKVDERSIEEIIIDKWHDTQCYWDNFLAQEKQGC